MDRYPYPRYTILLEGTRALAHIGGNILHITLSAYQVFGRHYRGVVLELILKKCNYILLLNSNFYFYFYFSFTSACNLVIALGV